MSLNSINYTFHSQISETIAAKFAKFLAIASQLPEDLTVIQTGIAACFVHPYTV
ncbi:hypothetical protein OOK60_03160 [Trichothermofontia sichuanensis B231]|uniref:hypothetical protein n=1 Tax=Trichothermofontia sichuanensis TaxID=3045816 RepID=UPI0022485D90|nr:hypothetical protein [Trichothermofontia sichuanensis]UZQ55089.1 hypothetical protein OOK60_03160 [Trichothermofontia sichuanensis B231]